MSSSFRFACALLAMSIAACGSPAPKTTVTPSPPAEPPPPKRWTVLHAFGASEPTGIDVSGERLWVSHGAAVHVFDAGKTAPETRFEGPIDPKTNRRPDVFYSACESNGQVFAVGQTLAVNPPIGVILQGVPTAGPLTPIKTATPLPSLRSVWCGERIAYALGDKVILRASTDTEASAREWTPVPIDGGPKDGWFASMHGVADDVWAVGGGGLAVHAAGGAWSKVETGLKIDLNIVWVAAKGDVWAVGKKATLLHTTDGGKSWAKVSIEVPRVYSPEIAGVYADGNIVLVGDSCGHILASEDGGAHFKLDAEVSSGCSDGARSFARRADGTVLAATNTTVWQREKKN